MGIEATADKIFFTAPSPVAEKLGGTLLKSKGVYHIPNTLGAWRELYKAGFPVMAEGMQAKETAKLWADLKQQVPPPSINPQLREYQRQDAHFLLHRDTAANFSEMRTGKTPIMCEVIKQMDVKTIIVCPSSLVLNWADELKKWTGIDAIAVKGTPKKRENLYKQFGEHGKVLVISKDTLKRDIDMVTRLRYQMAVVDEAHFLRKYQTQQSSAIFTLAKNTNYRYAITGTPATSAPDDVFGILKFLQPEKYKSYWQFVERYFFVNDGMFGKTVGNFKSEARKKEYHEVIQEISVQRKRKDVMQWLPPKQKQKIRLDMEPKQAKAYKEMLETFEIEETGLDAPTVLAQLTRLRQITSAPSALGLSFAGVKEKFIIEWLENNPNEQVIIFSNFSTYLKTLYERIQGLKYKTGIIIGETSKEARRATVEAFQKGHVRVLVANIEAAGVGLTMDAAGTAIFLDRSFLPASNDQAEDRIIATTQSSNTDSLIIDLVCSDSVDEKVLALVENKESITKIVNHYTSIKEWLL